VKASPEQVVIVSPKSREAGFTLIEVMIVVAIVAVLVAIALPSYSDYIRRGKILDATNKLSSDRVKMEQWFLDNRTYVGACVPPPTGAFSIATAPDDIFVIDCGTPTISAYTLTATGITGKGMDGFVYSIDNTNAKTSASPIGYTNGACWATRKDGSCN
jgi:type IV pilus assembly protein PilE